ncbi:MAG: N-acetylmuramoyl-L-alanine amidase [Rivularia sp. (in: cyanobacteria)]
MTKFAIDPGHNIAFDGGAAGINKSENQLIMEVAPKVIAKLQALGHEVVNCLPRSANSLESSLRHRSRTANSNKCDVFVSIHFNAFNGQAHGTEVLYLSNAGKEIATPVVEEIAKLGFRNRGLKYRDNLHVLRATTMPAILVECCFGDSWKDMKIFNTEKMAIAIVKGLTSQNPESIQECKCN